MRIVNLIDDRLHLKRCATANKSSMLTLITEFLLIISYVISEAEPEIKKKAWSESISEAPTTPMMPAEKCVVSFRFFFILLY